MMLHICRLPPPLPDVNALNSQSRHQGGNHANSTTTMTSDHELHTTPGITTPPANTTRGFEPDTPPHPPTTHDGVSTHEGIRAEEPRPNRNP